MFLRLLGWPIVVAIFLFCFACPVAMSAATSLPKGPVPNWVKPLPVSLTTSVKAKDVSGDYQVLLRDLQFDVESQTNYYHNGFVVFTDEGL